MPVPRANMGIIRSQSIRSTVITYIGFAIGALNTLLFSKYVSKEVFGLTRVMFSTSMIFYSLSTLGSVIMMNKFYPYYRDHLAPKNRDIMGLVVMMCMTGFLLVTGGMVFFKDLVVKKFATNAALFVEYYYLLIPFTFFLLLFTIFENYSNNQFKSTYPIFLKEVGMRGITTVFILLTITGLFANTQFIYAFAFIYAFLFVALFSYLYRTNSLAFSFRISNLTRKLWRKMFSFSSLLYAGSVFVVIATNIDTLAIASIIGIAYGGVFELSNYISNVILVPQRSVIAIAIPIIAKAWKDKDIPAIQSIYARSSLTLLIYALLIFMIIWLNLDAVYQILNLDPIFLLGKNVILLLGISRLIELGTGVNSQIIGTSNHWKFEFFSSLILLTLSIPLNIMLIKQMGMVGSGVTSLVTVTIFNGIRWAFLYKKYGLQPFSLKTLYVILIALGAYVLLQFILPISNPFISIPVKTIAFTAIFIGLILVFKISQDVTVTWHHLLDRYQQFRKKS